MPTTLTRDNGPEESPLRLTIPAWYTGADVVEERNENYSDRNVETAGKSSEASAAQRSVGLRDATVVDLSDR